MQRRNWYLLMNSLVGLWLAAAAVGVGVHRFVPHQVWLMVHLALLGTVSTAIYIWSQHFADTLLRRPGLGGRVSLGLRLATHTVGAVLVVIGMLASQWMLVAAGGVLVGLAAFTHAFLLWRQLRGALPSRFRPLVRYYIVASLMLIGGVTLGILLASAEGGSEHVRLLVGHVAFNFLGWIGLTVTGTAILLWPTILHARMKDNADTGIRRALPLLSAGILIVALAAAVDAPLLVAVGLAVWLVGIAFPLYYGAQQAREMPPGTFAGWSVGAGISWLVLSVAGYLVVVALNPDWVRMVGALMWFLIPFVAGAAVQIVIGALSYLLSVVIGGSPQAGKVAAEMLDRHSAFRVVAFNGGLLLYLLPLPSLVKVLLSGFVFGVLITWGVLAVRAVVAARTHKKQQPEPVQPGGGVPLTLTQAPAPRPRFYGAITAAIGVLALVVCGGVALDPASAGIGTFAANTRVTPTGQTTVAEVSVEGMRFVPATIEVPAGNELVINLTNTGTDTHDLTLATGLSTPRLAPGQSATIEAGVIGGNVEGWCSIAGHRQMGMVLDIVATGLGAGAEAGSESGSGSESSTAHHEGDSASAVPAAGAATDIDLEHAPGKKFKPWDAALPPASAETVHRVTLKVSENVQEVAPGVTQTLWSFGGQTPGPALRGKIGDTFIITLQNDGSIGHSIDFHAGALAPDKPMRTIQPGESLEYTFTATRAGIWMYHCSTMPMSLHIANGMFGAVVIDPPDLSPVDHEYLVVQSELYLGEQGGVANAAKIAAEAPDLVVFNGYANQYRFAPLTAKVGERVRVWVLDVGPSRPTSFHIVGGQFDTVFFEGDYQLKQGGSTGVGGSQALGLQAAQGGFVELAFPEAGNYSFVNHAMVDAERGANGLFKISK
ncbi:multicopper oxidase domain-containing protein [Leucobacter viscericola]|uniref:Copper-containing nitrite reductase n=1 Tax=Leucobacter viscericola TaxID=2714935 RepID=A0A6G7XD74_9MICO|nr:multicopper oxidase domain-containing protein [Leucobacter viscericola]QIK62503.1 multicopper oxidase domain-containing protein [Leucobacter viscericola]